MDNSFNLRPQASNLKSHRGFTLIELLVVVLIIAILALVAVPNLLLAQTRAKVARAKADLRTIAMVVEAYAVDENHYPPNDGKFNVIPIQLTTPVAFLTDSKLVDPFSDKERDPVYGELARFYTYDLIVTHTEWERIVTTGEPWVPPIEAVDSPVWNVGALEKYGRWRLVSNGPDRRYADPDYAFGSDPLDPNDVLQGADTPYDPTNGTVSKGNLIRVQKDASFKSF